MKRIALFGILFGSLIGFLFSQSCVTDNQSARLYGGTSSVQLNPGEKLVNATWKEADLWVLTRKARAEEKPEAYKFQEFSNYGIFQGTVVIREH